MIQFSAKKGCVVSGADRNPNYLCHFADPASDGPHLHNPGLTLKRTQKVPCYADQIVIRRTFLPITETIVSREWRSAVMSISCASLQQHRSPLTTCTGWTVPIANFKVGRCMQRLKKNCGLWKCSDTAAGTIILLSTRSFPRKLRWALHYFRRVRNEASRRKLEPQKSLPRHHNSLQPRNPILASFRSSQNIELLDDHAENRIILRNAERGCAVVYLSGLQSLHASGVRRMVQVGYPLREIRSLQKRSKSVVPLRSSALVRRR